MVEQIRQGDIPGVQLRYRHRLAAQPPDVWPWLIRPDLLGQWLSDEATADPSSDSTVALETVAAGGTRTREQLTVVRAQEPDLLVLDLRDMDGGWPAATRITIELSGRDSESEVSVLQEGFSQLPLSECLTIWETYRRRWRVALARLASLLAP